MLKHKLALVAAAVLAFSFALPMQAFAELEELQVHGQIRIRGNYLDPGFAQENPVGIQNTFGFNEDASNDDFYNALAEVNFTADMSDDVTGFIALRSYDIYGGTAFDDDDSQADEDDGLVGLNAAADYANEINALAGDGNDTVGMYQAYIQADNVLGYPLSVKIGRQEIALGREFLVGNNDDGVNFSGRAFDALRATYDNDESLMVTVFTAKLAETRNFEQDGDIDLHGLYATYYGLEELDIDLYWIALDNGVGGPVAPAPLPLGDDSELLHTFGGRVYGAAMDDRLEYNVEVAIQSGDINSVRLTNLAGMNPVFGPLGQSLDVDALAINVLVGYTFDDVEYTPEVHFEWALFTGDDDSTDKDFEQFTRLFSDVHYGKINLGGNFDLNMTNMNIFRIGGSAQTTDTVTVNADLLFFTLNEDKDKNVANDGFTLGRNQVNGTADDGVGTELDLWVTWQYSEDLTLSGGWSHFFVDDAIENAFSDVATGSQADDDLDYLWWEAALIF